MWKKQVRDDQRGQRLDPVPADHDRVAHADGHAAQDGCRSAAGQATASQGYGGGNVHRASALPISAPHAQAGQQRSFAPPANARRAPLAARPAICDRSPTTDSKRLNMSFRARYLLGIDHLKPDEIVSLLDLSEDYVTLNRRTVKHSDALAGHDPDQRVLRELDSHPHHLRTGRQAVVGGRDEHGRRAVVGEEGRDADRHGADAERDAARPSGGAPPAFGRGEPAGRKGELRRHQRGRRAARAPHPGPAGRADHPPRQGPAAPPDHRNLRRYRHMPRGPVEPDPAGQDGEPHPPDRPFDADARGRAPTWGSNCTKTCARG